jgi:hypothetical protein
MRWVFVKSVQIESLRESWVQFFKVLGHVTFVGCLVSSVSRQKGHNDQGMTFASSIVMFKKWQQLANVDALNRSRRSLDKNGTIDW